MKTCPNCLSVDFVISNDHKGNENFCCKVCGFSFAWDDNSMRKASAKRLVRENYKQIKEHYRRQEIKHHAGNEVECRICRSEFKSFASQYGWFWDTNADHRQYRTFEGQARCPNCGSLGRHRLLWEYLCHETTIFKGDGINKLLHWAPEEFFYETFVARPSLEYYPCDLSPWNENFIYAEGRVLQADITQLQFSSNFFDMIICSHVLEHIDDDSKGISELFRVLKKGGLCLIQSPVDFAADLTYEDPEITTPQGRELAFGQSDHVRIYGRDLSQRLSKGGFSVMEIRYAQRYSEEEIARYGIDRNEVIFHCTKT